MKNNIKLFKTLVIALVFTIFGCANDNDPFISPTPLEILKDEADIALLFNGDAEDEKTNLTFTTVEGAILTNDRKGNANNAYLFDGIDDYIEYAGIEAITNTETFTISVWAKNDEFPEVDEFQFIYSAELLFQLGLVQKVINSTSARRLTYALNNTNPDWISQYADLNEDATLFDGQWQHYILQYNNGVIKIYVNAIEKASFGGSGETISNLNLPMLIGAKPYNSGNGSVGEYFKGAIDDFMLFNKVLTESEIALLANDQ